MPDRITGPSRFATAELVGRLARGGSDDPSIAACLGITVNQVRGLRREFGIEAAERRWVAPSQRETSLYETKPGHIRGSADRG